MPPSEVIELSLCRVWLDEAGIVRIVFQPAERHGLEEAKALVEAHNAVSGGRKRAVLADLTRITTAADREARAYYVTPESARLKLAMAMITPSPFQRMLGNIFFRVNRPPYPSRMFDDEPSALRWLATFEEGV